MLAVGSQNPMEWVGEEVCTQGDHARREAPAGRRASTQERGPGRQVPGWGVQAVGAHTTRAPEDEVEVLERLRQEEALLRVVLGHVVLPPHVLDARVPSLSLQAGSSAGGRAGRSAEAG